MYCGVYPTLELDVMFTAVSAMNYMALYLQWPALSEHHAHQISHLFIYTITDEG